MTLAFWMPACHAESSTRTRSEHHMNTTGDTQDEPVQSQHVQPDDAKVAGILLQEEADLAGHDEPQVLDALRQRFADAELAVSDADLREHARRIAGLEPNDFSKE
jgi:hypothetical protein